MTLLYVNLLVVVVVPLFVQVVRKRRRTWTSRLWRQFAGSVVLSVVPFVAGLLLAQRVEQRVQFGDTISLRDPSLIALISLAMLALLAPVFVLSFFATSSYDRHVARRQISRGHSPNTR